MGRRQRRGELPGLCRGHRLPPPSPEATAASGASWTGHNQAQERPRGREGVNTMLATGGLSGFVKGGRGAGSADVWGLIRRPRWHQAVGSGVWCRRRTGSCQAVARPQLRDGRIFSCGSGVSLEVRLSLFPLSPGSFSPPSGQRAWRGLLSAQRSEEWRSKSFPQNACLGRPAPDQCPTGLER